MGYDYLTHQASNIHNEHLWPLGYLLLQHILLHLYER